MAKNLGSKIRELRKRKGLQLRKAAAVLDVDQSLLSKYERGDRLPNDDFVKRVAKLFLYDEQELMAMLMSDKFLINVTDLSVAGRALKIAEQQIKYSARKE
jgi:HTH-type transcriptional regulator, competence development regulator